MLDHEERGVPSLFKLHHMPKVKDLTIHIMCAKELSGKTAVTVSSR